MKAEPRAAMPNSRDRLEGVLSRLAARQESERVFLSVFADEARAAADRADARRKAGQSLGPLDGAIVSVKDIFDVQGTRTLAGSVARGELPPAAADAEVVRRLRAAGAVIVGKTNLNEFCFNPDGINPHFGTPGNARDPERIPGGSSSGAGVSVAEGTSDIGIGSDTGGSVRIPAALNGVVGFKPTASRVPLDGVFPLSPTLDSVGPLAATVARCAAADAVLAGIDEPALLERPIAGCRIGLPPAVLLAGTDEAVLAAFEDALRLLARQGAVLLPCPIDPLLAEMRELTRKASIASIEAAQIHADILRAGGARIEARTVNSLIRRIGFPRETYVAMLRRRAELAARMDALLGDFDVMVAPTVPILAPRIDALAADPALTDKVSGLLLRNTQIANQFDLTSISLPLPGPPLPAGLMLTARHDEDRHLLGLASTIETALAG